MSSLLFDDDNICSLTLIESDCLPRLLSFSSPIDTHWGQMAFYFPSPIKVPSGGGVKINGSMEMKRAKQNARLYNVHFNYTVGDNGDEVEAVYQIP